MISCPGFNETHCSQKTCQSHLLTTNHQRAPRRYGFPRGPCDMPHLSTIVVQHCTPCVAFPGHSDMVPHTICRSKTRTMICYIPLILHDRDPPILVIEKYKFIVCQLVITMAIGNGGTFPAAVNTPHPKFDCDCIWREALKVAEHEDLLVAKLEGMARKPRHRWRKWFAIWARERSIWKLVWWWQWAQHQISMTCKFKSQTALYYYQLMRMTRAKPTKPKSQPRFIITYTKSLLMQLGDCDSAHSRKETAPWL